MNKLKIITTESSTQFDQLATEIIFDIFDYLLRNDIIYAFFHLNRRFNSMVVEHQRYLNYFELPATNLNFWKSTLLIVGSHILSLSISIDCCCLSLDLFPNLKSMIITSLYFSNPEVLSLILESEQFNKLKSLKIRVHGKRYVDPHVSDSNGNEQILYRKILNSKNLLETFEYASCDDTVCFVQELSNLCYNYNIHSLSLNGGDFTNTLSIMKHVPNLKRLSITVGLNPVINRLTGKDLNLSHIQLEKLYVTVKSMLFSTYSGRDFHQLTKFIKQFTSSLIYLSIDLINVKIQWPDSAFNGTFIQQQLLEPMIELKKFNFYLDIHDFSYDIKEILSTFQTQFWLDHNWLIETNGFYLYTLPFRLNHLFVFQSSYIHGECLENSKILEAYSRLWFNITLVSLPASYMFDVKFITKLNKVTPYLKSIKFYSDCDLPIDTMFNEMIDKSQITVVFNRVRTIELEIASLKHAQKWLFFIFPNLQRIILNYSHYSTEKFLKFSFIAKIFEQIRDINFSELGIVTQIMNSYLPTIENIEVVIMDESVHFRHLCLDDIIFVFTKLKNLRMLSFYICCNDLHSCCSIFSIKEKFIKFTEILNSIQTLDEYTLRCVDRCAQILKISI